MAGSGTTFTKIVDSSNPSWATDKWKKFYGIYHVDDGYHNQIRDTVNGNTNTTRYRNVHQPRYDLGIRVSLPDL